MEKKVERERERESDGETEKRVTDGQKKSELLKETDTHSSTWTEKE